MRLGGLAHQRKLPSGPIPAHPLQAWLKDGTLYQDLGANHFDSRDKGKQPVRLVNRLQSLGFAVQTTSMAA